MSNTDDKINGYMSATTTIVNSWFILPKKAIEIAEPAPLDAGIISVISGGVTAISLATTYTYQYNKYVKLNKVVKWLIFGFVLTHIIAFSSILYLLVKQAGKKDICSDMFSKYFLPLVSVAMGALNIVDMGINNDKASAYRILNVINSFLKLANFGPIHESMKTQPEIYFPVHGVRALLKSAEGGALLLEVAKR